MRRTFKARKGSKGARAPLWVMTYADLMSLLLVLFVFIYSSRVVPEPPSPEPASAGVPDRAEWTYLGTLPSDEAALKQLAVRLMGSRSRVALVGLAPTHAEAFGAASRVRDQFVNRRLEADRFLLVSGGERASESPLPKVEVYSR